MKKYQIIYCDPPWDYKGQTQHTGKGGKSSGGAASHYPCMKLPLLKALSVPSITDVDCLMFMWTTGPHLDQAIELMKAWGFDYSTVGFVWDKGRVNPGFYTMSQCEWVLIGKRGKIPLPRGLRNVKQYVSAPRQKHSKKPDEVRDRIKAMFPTQLKLEMFTRQRVAGWDCHGNQVSNPDVKL